MSTITLYLPLFSVYFIDALLPTIRPTEVPSISPTTLVPTTISTTTVSPSRSPTMQPTVVDVSCITFCSVISSLYSITIDQLVAYVILPQSFRMDMEVSAVTLASTGNPPRNIFSLVDENDVFEWLTISTTETLALQIGYSNNAMFLSPTPILESDYTSDWTTISVTYDAIENELCAWTSATPTPYCQDVSAYAPGDTSNVGFTVKLSKGGIYTSGGNVRSLTFRGK